MDRLSRTKRRLWLRKRGPAARPSGRAAEQVLAGAAPTSSHSSSSAPERRAAARLQPTLAARSAHDSRGGGASAAHDTGAPSASEGHRAGKPRKRSRSSSKRHAGVFRPGFLESCGADSALPGLYAQAKPFSHLFVEGVIDDGLLRQAKDELLAGEWYRKRVDLYDFLQTDHLRRAEPASALLKLNQAFYSPPFRRWIEVSGLADFPTPWAAPPAPYPTFRTAHHPLVHLGPASVPRSPSRACAPWPSPLTLRRPNTARGGTSSATTTTSAAA